MRKILTLEDGVKVATNAPTPNFNPLTASTADLVANGFPAIPDDPKHRERFAQVWSRIKHKVHYIEPKFRIQKDRVYGPRKGRPAKITEATEASGNWSGAVVYAPAGQSFQWLEGDWVIPAVSAPQANETYYCATWIGIDGDGTGPGANQVFQSGVASDVTAGGSPTYYPWWEWFPAAPVTITNFPVNPGDMITMLLCSPNGAGSTTGTVTWTNVTTGASTNVSLSAPDGVTLAGNCAEWIVEAPTVGGGIAALADYGEVFFSVCQAYTNTGTLVDGGSQNNINLTVGGVPTGAIISGGNLITPTVVQCLYNTSQ